MILGEKTKPWLKHSQRFGGGGGGGGGLGGALGGGAVGGFVGGGPGGWLGAGKGSQDPNMNPFAGSGIGKGGKGGKGGRGGKGAMQGEAADLSTLKDFSKALPGINAGIAANQAQMGNIANQYSTLANPAAWNAFTQQQLGQFDVQGNALKQNTLNQLARQGITGTGASNALNMNDFQLNAQRQALTGQLGQQGLQFAGNMLGKEGGALGQQNLMGNEQLQNLLAIPGIAVGAAAAKNAGNVPGKKGGK